MMKVTLPEKKQLRRKKEKCNFVFLDKDLQLAKGLLFTIFYSVWISFLQIVPYFYVLILIWDWVTLVSFLVFKDLSKVKDHKQGKRKGFCKENLPDRIKMMKKMNPRRVTGDAFIRSNYPTHILYNLGLTRIKM